MQTFNTMKNVLKKTALYRLNSGTAVEAELSVYAQELDTVWEQLESLEQEGFAAHASGQGLTEFEKLYGLFQIEKEDKERRTAILSRSKMNEWDFTRESMEQILRAEGFSVRLYESPATMQVTANVLESEMPSAHRAALSKAVLKFLPAHLQVRLDFRDISWDTIDKRAESFDEWDKQSLTWEELDLYKNGIVTV